MNFDGFHPFTSQKTTERCSSLVHVANEAAIFTLFLRHRVVFLHCTVTCRPLFKPWISLLPTYRKIERCFEFLSHFQGFHLTHLRNSWDRGLPFGYKGLIFNCQLQIREGKQCVPLFNGPKGCTKDQSWSKCMDHSVPSVLYSVLFYATFYMKYRSVRMSNTSWFM